MRKLILNLHLYGALIGGLFLIVLGVTGIILAIKPEIDHLLNPGLFRIAPQTQALPLSKIEEAVRTKYPGKNFGSFTFPQSSDESYITQFQSTQVFVNSYTGEIIGTRQKPTVLDQIRSLHTNLWLGQSGRNLVAAATVLSILLLVSGIYLWWPVRKTGTARGLSFYLHYALGIYFALFMLLLSVSGTVMAFEWIFRPWLFSVTHSPAPSKYFMPSTMIPGKAPISCSEALNIATNRLPGALPIMLSTPGYPKGSYGIDLQYPGDFRENRVLVDQYSGTVLSVIDSRQPSTAVRIMTDNGAIHTGEIFGLPSKIVMSLASLVLALQVVTGYWLWWKKLRRKPDTV